MNYKWVISDQVINIKILKRLHMFKPKAAQRYAVERTAAQEYLGRAQSHTKWTDLFAFLFSLMKKKQKNQGCIKPG